MGIQTVAESVADDETIEMLHAHGVDFAQGFHIGRPAPVATLFGTRIDIDSASMTRVQQLYLLMLVLLVIFALLCGQQLYGVVGAILALPIMAILRETAVYLSRHLAFEPWDRSPGPLL